MRIGGVRAAVWTALGTSALLLAAALGSMRGGGTTTPARRAPVLSTRAPRPAPAPAPAPFSVAAPHADTRMGRQSAHARAEAHSLPAEPATPDREPRTPERTPELVGLEREAAGAAEASGLLGRDEVEARLAKLRPARGESPRDFADRVDATRDRIWSDELLVQSKLAELYDSTAYPEGFPIDLVEAQERQLVEQMPAADRAERLRIVLDGGSEPHRAQPQFLPPGPGNVWEGGRTTL